MDIEKLEQKTLPFGKQILPIKYDHNIIKVTHIVKICGCTYELNFYNDKKYYKKKSA